MLRIYSQLILLEATLEDDVPCSMTAPPLHITVFFSPLMFSGTLARRLEQMKTEL